MNHRQPRNACWRPSSKYRPMARSMSMTSRAWRKAVSADTLADPWVLRMKLYTP